MGPGASADAGGYQPIALNVTVRNTNSSVMVVSSVLCELSGVLRRPGTAACFAGGVEAAQAVRDGCARATPIRGRCDAARAVLAANPAARVQHLCVVAAQTHVGHPKRAHHAASVSS